MKIKKNFFLALFAMGINASFAQPKGLSVGDIAPDFKATSQDGSLISLKKELKNGPVVLFFTGDPGAPIATNKWHSCRIHCNL